MRAVRVVLRFERSQLERELPLAEDQHPVKTLAPDGADPPLGVGGGLRRARRTIEDFDAEISEHGVEARGELGVAIADQEPETVALLPQREREVTSRLGDPLPVGCRVTPRTWTRRLPTSSTKNTWIRCSTTVSTVNKSRASIVAARARQNSRHDGP
jgi:hypothetical protein